MIIGKFLTFKILAWIPLYFGIGMLTFMADKTRKQTIGHQLNALGFQKVKPKFGQHFPPLLKKSKVKSKFGQHFPPLLKKSNQIGSQ